MKEKAILTLGQAKREAKSYTGHKEKLLSLIDEGARKSEQCYEFLLAPWESLQIFFRLLHAQLAGKFTAPAEATLAIVAAVVYFVSPLDLIPDSIPVLGLVDDACVITCVARANLTLISNFRNWETFRERDLTRSRKHPKKTKAPTS
jgi:uncharacterized membrane protein YkvA (DUF1232 family)